MKHLSVVILNVVVIFFLVACCKDDANCHKTIAFNNASEKDVYVTFDRYYPDTLYIFHSESPTSESENTKVLSKSSSNRPLDNEDCWESDFNYKPQPLDNLMVYVFDAEILETTDWSVVAHNYLVLKRYDLSLEDLQGMNWTITYP
jgi:hypothetical protein